MLSSKEIYSKNAKGFFPKSVVNKQQNRSDARTTEQSRTAIKEKFSGNMALSSRQVTTEALHALKYFTLICSKIYYGVMFFSSNH